MGCADAADAPMYLSSTSACTSGCLR